MFYLSIVVFVVCIVIPLSTPLVVSAQSLNDYMAEGIRLVNELRNQNGLGSLCLQQKLIEAAVIHSQDMALHSFLDHIGSNGKNPFDRMHDLGYNFKSAAENVAFGSLGGADDFTKPLAPFISFSNSPGHRANMLNSKVTQMGVAFAIGKCPNGFNAQCGYWTQTFGTSDESCLKLPDSSSINSLALSLPPIPAVPIPPAPPVPPVLPAVPISPAPQPPVTAPVPSMNEVDTEFVTGLQILNQFREKHQRRPLCLEEKLLAAAQMNAKDMASRQVLTLYESNGKSLFDNLRAGGYAYSRVTANIATGTSPSFDSIQAPINRWISKPSQCAKLLNEQFTQIGIGKAVGMCPRGSAQCTYWTLILATSSGPSLCIK